MKSRWFSLVFPVLVLGLVVLDMVTASRSLMIDYPNSAPDAYFCETGSDTADYVMDSPEISAQAALLRSDNSALSSPVDQDQELTPEEIEDMVYTVLEMDLDQTTGLPNLQRVIDEKKAENGDSCWVVLKWNLVAVAGNSHTSSDQTDPRVGGAVLRYLAENTEATRITLLGCGSYGGYQKTDIFEKSMFDKPLGRWVDHFPGLPDDFSLAGMVEEIQADNPDKILDMINLNYDELYDNGKSFQEMTSTELKGTTLARVPVPEYNGTGALYTTNVKNSSTYTPTKAIYMSDILVNVPKMKNTGDVEINCAFKNYIGSVSRGIYGNNNNRTQWLSQLDHTNLWETCINLFSYHPSDYVLVDALNCMEGDGSHPWKSYTGCLRRNFLVASSDPVASESVCLQSMGFHPGDVDMIRWARAKGWGYYEPNRIRMLGDDLASVIYPFRPAVGEDGNPTAYYRGRGCTRWLLCGPFEGNDLSAYPGGEDPAELDPGQGEALAGKIWSAYISPGTVVDLQQALEPTLENTTVYAFTRIYSPEAQTGLLRVGATEGVKVWVNGELVLEGPENLGYNQKKFEEALSLAAGDNRILVLVSNTSGDFGFSLACVNDGSETIRETLQGYTWENDGWTGMAEPRVFTEDEKARFFGGHTLPGTFYHLAAGPGETEKRSCDIDGNGRVNIVDVVRFMLDMHEHPDDLVYDWSRDGTVSIADVIALLLDVMHGNCLEQQEASLAASGDVYDGSARAENLSGEDLEYLEEMIARMNLTEEQEAALRMTIYGNSGAPELPRSFDLEQNSPNPFNPSTTIAFSVPTGQGAQAVRLSVHDIRGRLIRTLVDEVREPGRYTIYWDGGDSSGRRVASGVYFYRLQAGPFSSTRKMVLLK